MDSIEVQNKQRSGDERRWFFGLGIPSLLWLTAFLPQWFVWSFEMESLGLLASLVGGYGAVMWLGLAASLRSRRMLVVALIMGLGSLATLQGAPTSLKIWATLGANEARYMEVIGDITGAPEGWVETQSGDRVLVDDSGGTIRVAFSMENGFMDDYTAIIYDPSGVVASPSSRENEEIFNGVLGSVRHVRESWYEGVLYPD